MIIVDCEQGSPEWIAARCGIPTASEFERICTPARMEYAKGARTYAQELLQEQIEGPRDGFTSGSMLRGSNLEAQALAYYQFTYDVELERVGFCLADHGRYGCSPDALVKGQGQRRGVEIKAPELDTHIGYVLDNALPDKYKIQVLGNLLVTGCDAWDFFSYHPSLKPLRVTVERAAVEKQLQILEQHLDRFCAELIQFREAIAA